MFERFHTISMADIPSRPGVAVVVGPGLGDEFEDIAPCSPGYAEVRRVLLGNKRGLIM